MPFDIKTIGATTTIVLRTTTSEQALASGVFERIAEQLPGWARDPEIYATIISFSGDAAAQDAIGTPPSREHWRAGIRLAWRLECYSKPTVSLVNGPIQGFLAGLVMSGTHRVAGESYTLRVPPAALLVPGGGGLAHGLAHLPTGIGAYLVSTGAAVTARDALPFGLVTHVIPHARFPEIEAGLAAAEPIDQLLDDRNMAPTRAPDDTALARLIADCFAVSKVAAIKKSLATYDGAAASSAPVILAAVEATAASSPLDDALTRLADAGSADLRTSLISSYAAATGEILDLPTRRELQSLRGR